MKMKEFGPPGGARPCPHLDLPLHAVLPECFIAGALESNWSLSEYRIWTSIRAQHGLTYTFMMG